MAKTTGAKRARKPKETNNGAASLIEALKFVNLAQHREGAAHQTHCVIGDGKIVAFDGVIAAGHLIEDNLSACPHTARLLDALAKCGQNLSITQLDSGRLSIKSDKFKAFIPCVEKETLPYVEPDAPCADIDDRLKAGFLAVMPLLSETAQVAHFAAALLQNASVVSTNGAVLIEFWHGLHLPNNLLVPKAALVAITKTPKKLARFGFSPHSATFFFEDDSFIRTQLFSATYPNYQAILDEYQTNPWPLPAGFFEGMHKIQSLADDKLVHFDKSGMFVRDSVRNQSGSFEMEGLREGLIFNMEYLSMIEPHFKKVDFETRSEKAFFFSDDARGAIMACKGG